MSFSYKRSLTIDRTKCGSTNRAYFPVHVKLSFGDGKIQSPSGYDVYFYSDSELTTRLPAERETFNANGDVWTGWVQLPAVKGSGEASDTVFYVAYGDASISSDPNSDATYGAEKTWNENGTQSFKGVWHLPNGSTLTALDSTPNNNDGSLSANPPTAVAGKVDGAASFASANSQYINAGNGNSLNITGDLTITAWIKTTSTTLQAVIQRYNTGSPYEGYGLFISQAVAGKPTFYSNGGGWDSFNSTIHDGNWHHVAVRLTGGTAYCYKDGAADGTPASGSPSSISWNFYIGCSAGAGQFFEGQIDEVHVSNVARSADWILTEFNNQNDPGDIGNAGFYTVGDETAIGAASKSVSDTATGSDALGSLAVAFSLSDAGHGSESLPIGAAMQVSDAGSGADALAAILAVLSIAESGGGSDALTQLRAALSIADLASGADALASLAASLHVAETGAAVDSPLVQALLSLGDAGAGSDALSISQSLLKVVSDLGQGTDGFAVVAQLTISESGAGLESPSILVFIALDDSGTGADAISTLSALLKSISDSGSGIDSSSISVALALADSAHAADIPIISATIPVNDLGSGIESILVLILKAISDAGSGSDSLSISVRIPIADAGTGVESLLLSALLRIAESGHGIDAAACSGFWAAAHAAAAAQITRLGPEKFIISVKSDPYEIIVGAESFVIKVKR